MIVVVFLPRAKFAHVQKRQIFTNMVVAGEREIAYAPEEIASKMSFI
jgi:hypothetical protein